MSELAQPQNTVVETPQMNDGIKEQENDVKGKGDVSLLDIEVSSENMALNVMVGFLNVAQRRGSFTIDESAKIAECINKFKRDQQQQQQQSQ
jgi:hypothetical protein